jgi:hypothetical protein
MLNLTGNEVLTELSLNGVGVRDLMFRASPRNPGRQGAIPLLDCASVETGRRVEKRRKKSSSRGRKTIRVTIHCARDTIRFFSSLCPTPFSLWRQSTTKYCRIAFRQLRQIPDTDDLANREDFSIGC